jgi:hypothetical protein
MFISKAHFGLPLTLLSFCLFARCYFFLFFLNFSCHNTRNLKKKHVKQDMQKLLYLAQDLELKLEYSLSSRNKKSISTQRFLKIGPTPDEWLVSICSGISWVKTIYLHLATYRYNNGIYIQLLLVKWQRHNCRRRGFVRMSCNRNWIGI